jgi:class 3 adenylate cyclase
MPKTAALTTFISRLHARTLARPSPRELIDAEPIELAALFADVSGFTALSERLAQEGSHGAERLAALIRDHFSRIAEIITSFDGDIAHFAGDAVLAIWPASGGRDIRDATIAAAAAASSIQQMLIDRSHEPSGPVLSVRATVSAGPAIVADIVDNDGARSLLVGGAAIRELYLVDEVARPGEVLLAPGARFHIGSAAHLEDATRGAARLRDLVAPSLHTDRDHDEPHVDENDVSLLLPRALLHGSAPISPDHIGQFRTITGLFVAQPEPDWSDAVAARRFRDSVAEMHRIVRQFDGTVFQHVVDAGGMSFVAVFGLPAMTHDDDTDRSVRVALEILASGRARQRNLRIGLATGLAYCGTYGSQSRSQYAVVGTTMIRAARLAQIAGEDEILVDAATQHRSSWPGVAFQPLPPRELKGLRGPVRHSRARERAGLYSRQLEQPRRDTVGRSAELRAFSTLLWQVASREGGGSILVEGEAGSGKSHLVAEFIGEARNCRVRVAVGSGDAARAFPYHVWRPVFLQLLELPAYGETPEEITARVLGLLGEGGIRDGWLPLLNAVLPTHLPESSATHAMRDEARAENTRSLLVELLAAQSRLEPTAIVIEDEHWGDSSSRQLLRAVAARVPQLALLVTGRPSEGGATDELFATHHFVLGALAPEETRALVCARLSATSLSREVLDFIQQRSAGNPLYAEELSLLLSEYQIVGVRDGACVVETGGATLAHAYEQTFHTAGPHPPIEAVIMSRIDRLPADQQQIIRIASVLGPQFDAKALQCVALLSSEEETRSAVGSLTVHGLIERASPNESTFVFHHSVTRDVAYASLPFAQRRELHGRAARRYEERAVGDLQRWTSTLAYHWKHADDSAKAFYYSLLAGQNSLRAHAAREAIGFLSDALLFATERDALSTLDIGARNCQLAQLELLLGRAFLALSRYAEDRLHLESGVRLLGFALPSTTPALAVGIIREALLQVFHRTSAAPPLRRSFHTANDAERRRYLDASDALEALAETYYYSGAETRTLYACLRTLNLAERAGVSGQLARGFATLGTIIGYIPLHALSERYGCRSVAAAREAGDVEALTYVCTITGIARAGRGDWSGATSLFEEASGLAQRTGDRRRWADALGHLVAIGWLRGEIGSALENANLLCSSAAADGDVRYQVEALRIRAHILLDGNETEAACKDLAEVQHLIKAGLTAIQKLTQRDCESMWALLNARTGDNAAALNHARTADRMLQEGSTTDDLYLGFLAPAALAEASLLIAEQGMTDATAIARRACTVLAKHGRIFRVAQPRSLLCSGMLAAFDGRMARARKSWMRASTLAHALELPIDGALADAELARHAVVSDEDREKRLNDAATHLTRMKATYYASLVRSWMVAVRQAPVESVHG